MKRWLKILGVGTGIVVLLLIAAGVILHVFATRELHHQIAELERVGGHASYVAYAPAPVPDADNAAILWAEAFDALPPHRGGISKSRFGEQHEATLEDLWAADVESLRALIEPQAHVLDLARQAAGRPACAWPFNYDPARAVEDWEDLVPLRDARDTARLLVAEARLAIEQGDESRARENLRAVLALGDDLSSTPSVVSELTRISLNALVLEFIEKAGASRSPGDPALVTQTTPRDLRKGMRAALLADVAWALDATSTDDLNRIDTWPVSVWYRYDKARFVRLGRVSAEAALLPYHEAEPVLGDLADELETSNPLRSPLSGILLPAAGPIHRTLSQFQARQLLAETALTLREHRTQHGAYPEQFETPICPLTNQRFRYQRLGDGFALWSTAADRSERDFLCWRWDTQEWPAEVPETGRP